MTLSYLASFLRPQCGKSRFLEVRTENCILEPRKPMSEDQQGVLLGVTEMPNFVSLSYSSMKRNSVMVTDTIQVGTITNSIVTFQSGSALN